MKELTVQIRTRREKVNFLGFWGAFYQVNMHGHSPKSLTVQRLEIANDNLQFKGSNFLAGTHFPDSLF